MTEKSQRSGGDAALPVSAGVEQFYFKSLEEGVWHVPRCTSCKKVVFYPRVLCPLCGGRTFDWFEPSGLGTLYSTTVMRRPAQAGGDMHLCLVDLDEGFRMMSHVQGVAPELPAIGDRVRAYVDYVHGHNLVLFHLLEVVA